MHRTPIEWVKNPPPSHLKVDKTGRWHDPAGRFAEQPGFAWNPITGCLKRCSYCYAWKLAKGRLKNRYLSTNNLSMEGWQYYNKGSQMAFEDPFYPRFWEDELREPLKRKKPAGIFACDMSDLFGLGIPHDWTSQVMDIIKRTPWHRYYLLTKQGQNMLKYSPFPDHCYVGITSTCGRETEEACDILMKVEARVKFLSLEPLLGTNLFLTRHWFINAGISQVIIGAQTNPYKPPTIEAVRDIVHTARSAGIAVFLKHNLKPLLLDYADDESLVLTYEHGESEFDGLVLHMRQELPVIEMINRKQTLFQAFTEGKLLTQGEHAIDGEFKEIGKDD